MSLAMRRGPLGTDPAGWFDAPVPDHVLYVERSPRRVRAVLAGATIVDTRRAHLVHETGRTAGYYFPRADVATDLLAPTDHREDWPARGRARYWSVVVGERRAVHGAWSHPDPPAAAAGLADLVALRWDAMDAWYEEDEQVFLEPRDPYHRVDALVSSRHVRVERDGERLADSNRPVVVFETGSTTRYYLRPADVRTDLLAPSSTVTRCQYKGLASYWTLTLPDGRTVDDAAWTYHDPNPEAAAIAGRVCFSHRGTDVVVDGQPARPRG